MPDVVLDRYNRGVWCELGRYLAVRTLYDDDANVVWVRSMGIHYRGVFDREWLTSHLGEWLPVDMNEWGPHRVEVAAFADDPVDTIRVRRA